MDGPWSFSRRKTYFQCRAKFERQYLIKPRPPYVESEAQAVGNAADEILERLVAKRLNGEITSPVDAVSWLQTQVDDWDDSDGMLSSIKQDAVWCIQGGMTAVGRVMKMMKDATLVETQAALWFDEKWVRREDAGNRGFVPRGAPKPEYGGDLDLLIVKGRTGIVVDWKTGKSQYQDDQQVQEYGAYVLAHYDVDEVELYFAWLKDDRLVPVGTMNRAEGDAERARIEKDVKKIKRTKKFPREGEFPACFNCCVVDCEKRVVR